MKNSFKITALALAIAVSFAACKGKTTTSADSLAKADSSKVDSSKVDSSKKDTAAKKDTTAKKM